MSTCSDLGCNLAAFTYSQFESSTNSVQLAHSILTVKKGEKKVVGFFFFLVCVCVLAYYVVVWVHYPCPLHGHY